MSSLVPEKVVLCGLEFAVVDNERQERHIIFEHRGARHIRFVFGWFEEQWLTRSTAPEEFPTDLYLEARAWVTLNYRLEDTPHGLRPERTTRFKGHPTSARSHCFRRDLDRSPWAPGGCAGDTLGDAY